VRLDVFLHAVCLLKSRTLAKEACDRGRVTVNGAPAKGSHTVHAGERVRVDLGTRVLDLEVTAVPPGRTSRREAAACYRLRSGSSEETDDKERAES
jgi:ribosomal 50S subunit-recycling heat shock protein